MQRASAKHNLISQYDCFKYHVSIKDITDIKVLKGKMMKEYSSKSYIITRRILNKDGYEVLENESSIIPFYKVKKIINKIYIKLTKKPYASVINPSYFYFFPPLYIRRIYNEVDIHSLYREYKE